MCECYENAGGQTSSGYDGFLKWGHLRRAGCHPEEADSPKTFQLAAAVLPLKARQAPYWLEQLAYRAGIEPIVDPGIRTKV